MTAKKWGNALENASSEPSLGEEIKALRELLVEKGVITKQDADASRELRAQKKANVSSRPA